MGSAVHRKNVGMKYPVMGMNQVKFQLCHFSSGKKGKADSSEKPGKNNQGNLMKGDTLKVRPPPVGKDVDIVAGIAGDTFGQFLDKSFRPAHQAVFGNNNCYFVHIWH